MGLYTCMLWLDKQRSLENYVLNLTDLPLGRRSGPPDDGGDNSSSAEEPKLDIELRLRNTLLMAVLTSEASLEACADSSFSLLSSSTC